MPLISERRIARVNRAVESGRIIPYLAVVTLVIAALGGLVVWLITPNSFNSFGDAMWWAAQTVTTVGYGDVIPATGPGKVVAVFVMLFGVAAVSFMTAVVTAVFVSYQQRRTSGAEDQHELLEVLTRIERRLEAIEQRPR
jgi:voltage-gated potassium channel